MKPSPRYKHNCKHCEFLGGAGSGFGQYWDAYICKDRAMILRYSDKPESYWSHDANHLVEISDRTHSANGGYAGQSIEAIVAKHFMAEYYNDKAKAMESTYQINPHNVVKALKEAKDPKLNDFLTFAAWCLFKNIKVTDLRDVQMAKRDLTRVGITDYYTLGDSDVDDHVRQM